MLGRLRAYAGRGRAKLRNELVRHATRVRTGSPVPSRSLRQRVHGDGDVASYLAAGEACARDLEAAFARVDAPLHGSLDVLDWGCGSGRTLRALLADDALRLNGSDIDEEAIAWAKKAFRTIRFEVNGKAPPLAFADGSFDRIYAVSVLTHLDAPDQLAWVEEMRRLLRPGGVCVLSTHGPDAARMTDEDRAALAEHGFVFMRQDRWVGIFPEWYQTSAQTDAWSREAFAPHLEVVDVMPKALNAHQDLVVMRKR